MVELRQRVLQKNRSPPPDALRNGDSGGPVPRRSSRRAGPELDDRQSEQRLKATYKNGIITISGLAPRESNQDDAGAGTDNDSQEANLMTWEDRWLESPSKRRKLDRSGSSQANSPVKDSARIPPSPTDTSPIKPPLSGNGSDAAAFPSIVRPEDELPRVRRGRFGRNEIILGRPRTTSSRFLNSTATSTKSLRGTSFGSPGELSEAPDHQRLTKESFDGAENFSSARSTPIHAMSPAHSESPSPGPPEQDDVPNGESAEAKEPNQLDDHDFPPPFLPFPPLSSSDQYSDEAAYLLSKLFPPMSQPNRFIRALTSHTPSDRSTETLLALAENTQKALKAWQDEYLRLDKRTAPVSIPIPKKPATGGRIPADPAAFEAEKLKELYGEGSVLAAAMGIVHGPVEGKRTTNNSAASNGNIPRGTGRELRKRKGDPAALDGLGISSDDAGGRLGSKRTRRPARRFEIGQNAQEALEPEPVPAKPMPGRRRRRGGAQALSQRPTEKEQSGRVKRGRLGALLRGESTAGSSAATPEVEEERDRKTAKKTAAQDVAQSIEQKAPRTQPAAQRGTQASTIRTASTTATANAGGATTAVSGKVPIQANTTETTGPSGRRQKAKSEKRSESMTLWWAQRKKKAAEEKMRQMRERGELYGPTEGIMDTSEPINIGINKKRNTAAMNSQANATSAPSVAANKNFHARPMSMSMSHSYGPNQAPHLPPMHHQQQQHPPPMPPGSGYMWPNPPTPGAQRNQPWSQQQPFHLPHSQHSPQESNQPGRGQPYSHFPPPPPDHAVLGRGPPPGHNYPPPQYMPNNPPGGPMPPHPGQHHNPYPPPYDPRDPRASQQSGHPPAHSPVHHHAPPPLLPPPTPSQQHAHQPPHEHSRNSSLRGGEGDSRGPPPPPAHPREEPGPPRNQGTPHSQPHYHHPSHPGYGPIARSPPSQGYPPPPNQAQQHQTQPQQQQQQQQKSQQPHNYMHVQQLPLAAAPSSGPHHAPLPPPPPPPPGPSSGPPQSGQIHPPPPPPNQQPGQSPSKQDQQPPLQPPRQQNHYYQMPWAPARFGRY